MVWLLALLGAAFGGFEPSSTTSEAPLPLHLAFAELEPALPEIPERDSWWRVDGLDASLPRAGADADSSVFRWPEFTILLADGDRLRAPGEKWEPYLASRIDLGIEKLRQMEAESQLFPTVTRAILGLPMGLIEALTTAVAPDVIIVNDKQVFNQVAASEDLATISGRSIMKTELHFLAGIQRSYVNTIGVQLGTEEIDRRRFNRLQWRALFNGMKNAYRERYQIPSMDLDTILTAMSTGDWVDFIIVPAAVSVYAARFGIERKFRLGDDIRVELQIEKATRLQRAFMEDRGGRLLSASINFFRLPVSAIISLEGDHGGVGIGFVGIGTDINSALTAIVHSKGPRFDD